MAEYRLTPTAERDLESIWTYTTHHWGVEQANRYIDLRRQRLPSWRNHPKQRQPASAFGQAIAAGVLSGT